MKISKRIFFTLLFALLVNFLNTVVIFAAQAGRVVNSFGSLVAVSGSNQRILQTGSVFYTGELLVTGGNSHAELQLQDNSKISLNANTRYHVNEIQTTTTATTATASTKKITKKTKASQQAKNTKQQTAKYSATISRGGLRNVTGSIAKKNPREYKTSSPVTTVSVRGTLWETAVIGFQQAIGAYVGQVAVQTVSGDEVVIGEGRPFQYVLITSATGTAQTVNYPPALLLSVFEPTARDLLKDIRTILYQMRINRANVSPFGEEEPNLQNASSNAFAITQQQLNTLFNTTLATLPG